MATIGIMDSGVGGLSVFREIRKLLPSEHYVYYSDSANCPYGEKDPEFIRSRCREITRTMLSKGASAMVIACNTATAAAITALRSEFSIPFIGMEPAVKPAALGTRTGTIGVLATAGTLKGSNYLKLKHGVQDGIRVVEHVGRGFVELVERGELDGPSAEETVSRSLQPLLAEGADIIVLGCTHYPFLLPLLQRIAGPGIRFIDPAPAVARHLLDLLEQNGIGRSDALPDIELLGSGDPVQLRNSYRMLIGGQ
ncbi:MAG TPA: glutamate racemase [Candidatus Cryptobacteroides excrementigallinarum]|nr:glutamate racemase [Candidatus Cryptobacteroides excrementigallinarum]